MKSKRALFFLLIITFFSFNILADENLQNTESNQDLSLSSADDVYSGGWDHESNLESLPPLQEDIESLPPLQ